MKKQTKKNGPLKLTAADIAKLSPQVREKLGLSAPSASDGKGSRPAKGAHGPKRFKVSYYSPMRGRRLEFLAPIAAGTPGAAKQQGRAMVTNEPKPLNFIAVEVKENRGQKSEIRGQKKNTENLFGLGKSKRGRTKKEKRTAAKRTFKADKLEARARYLRSQNPKENNGERLSVREQQPYFCADCDADLSGKPARKMKDGRTICIRCAKVIADKMADRKQQRMGGKKLYSQGDLQDYEFANPAVVYDIFLRGKKLDSTRAFRPSSTFRSSYEAMVKKILVKGGLDPKIVVKERRLKNPATKANPISPLELAGHAATWIMGAHSAHLLMKDLKGDVTRFGKSPKKLTAGEAAKRLREERKKKEQQAVGRRQKNPDGRNTINDVLGVLVGTLSMNEHRARALVRKHRKSIAEKLKDGKPASLIATWLARKKEKNPALVDAIVQGAGFTLGAGAVAATGLAALESAGGRKLKRAILKNPASKAAIEKWFERERSRLIPKHVAPEHIAPKQWARLYAKYRKLIERLKAGHRKQKKKAATPGNEKLGKKFLGRKTNGEVIKLFTPPGTPKRIRYFGPITSFELMNGRTVPFPKGFAFFGGATRGKTQRYYVGLKQPFTMPNGFKANKVHDYGAIKTVNYSASKPHLYGTDRVFNFYHNHGEEGGQRPHLILYNGTIGIAGGDYKIQARGLRD